MLTALATLIRLGFVREVGSGSSTGGRPPVLVCFEARAAYAVGVELGASGMELAVTDLTVEVVAHTTARIDVDDGPGIVLDGIEKLIRSALADAGIDLQQVCGVGMGLPGPVDRHRVRQVSPPLLRGWDDYCRRAAADRVHHITQLRVGPIRGHRHLAGQDPDQVYERELLRLQGELVARQEWVPLARDLITKRSHLDKPCEAADFERIGETWWPYPTSATVLVRAAGPRIL